LKITVSEVTDINYCKYYLGHLDLWKPMFLEDLAKEPLTSFLREARMALIWLYLWLISVGEGRVPLPPRLEVNRADLEHIWANLKICEKTWNTFF